LIRYIFADIFINCLQCSQIIPVEEQIFGLILVAVVRYSVRQDHIAPQLPKKFLVVVGIVLFQPVVTR